MSSAVSTGLEPREHGAIWLIGAAHFVSHFYHLALPPLYLLVTKDLGLTWVEVGIPMILYFVATAIVQVPIGLLVDKIGARVVLVTGLALMGLALVIAGMLPSYYVLMAAFFVAGIGNAVFHPADFSILSASIRESHLGRAFAYHSFGGSIGYASAPFVMVLFGSRYGWQNALIFAGVLGVVMAVIIALFGASLRDYSGEQKAKEKVGDAPKEAASWRVMLTRPMILFFLFYVATSASGTGMTAYTIPALPLVYDGVSTELAGTILTCFLIAAIVGAIPGGWLADWARLEYLVVVGCFLIMALTIVLIGSGTLSLWLLFGTMIIAGLMRGLYNASRDVLVRRASPSSSVGTAFGFVTLGYTLGQGATPILYGWLMDNGMGSGVFYVSAGAALLAMFIVLIPGQGQKPVDTP
jgi:MFS transporter, FSR family, fosmidomycin resistance protein